MSRENNKETSDLESDEFDLDYEYEEEDSSMVSIYTSQPHLRYIITSKMTHKFYSFFTFNSLMAVKCMQKVI